MEYHITEFLGDGISAELSQAVRTVLKELPIQIELFPVDLSLQNRNEKGEKIFEEAFESISRTKYAIKYPTTTEKMSPNAIIRRMCQFSVIHRPVMTIPGVKNNFKGTIDLDIVRVATGGTYDDPGKMIGRHTAVSIRIVERIPCEEAARFAFHLAKKLNKDVTSSSKYTIQRVTDGLFEEVVNEIAQKFPEVRHKTELFDAMLAKIVINPQDFGVIVVLNEYGDFLSDMACGLVGSIGIGGSGNYSFDERGDVRLAMFDPAGGTAPDIAGKNLANPTAIFIALSLLFQELGEVQLGQALRESILVLLSQGKSTRDLGGNLSTTEFTDTVIRDCLRRL